MPARRPRPARPRPLGEPAPAPSPRHRPECAPQEQAVVDAFLVAAGRGDTDAFAAFYDSTAPRIVGLFHAVVGRLEPAESLTAEVYLTVWRDAPTFDPHVRSADATLMRAARRALVGPVRQRLASTASTDAGPADPPDTGRRTRLTDDDLRQENSP